MIMTKKNKNRWFGWLRDGKFKIIRDKSLIVNAVTTVSCDPLGFEAAVLEVCPVKPSSDIVIDTIQNQLMTMCSDVGFIEQTQNLILSDTSFFELAKAENTNLFISKVSESLNVTRGEAVEKISNYFETTNLLVQPTGIQGVVYNVGTFAETAVPASIVGKSIVMARTLGVQGVKFIVGQPVLAIALPSVGGLFFHGCGTMIGNNTVGRSFITVGNVLFLLLGCLEHVYNKYGAPAVHGITGIPTVLNFTKQISKGAGLSGKEAMNLLNQTQNTSVAKMVKCWFIKKLGGTC